MSGECVSVCACYPFPEISLLLWTDLVGELGEEKEAGLFVHESPLVLHLLILFLRVWLRLDADYPLRPVVHPLHITHTYMCTHTHTHTNHT